MSKVLPILFNTDMVLAILDGRKKVTRRCLKYPYTVHPNGYITKPRGNENLCPYIPPYQLGDILYVRETWSTRQSNTCIGNTTGICPYDSCETASGPCFDDEYIYKATDNLDSSVRKWHPSIHMPKKAARIFLRVTDARVERLQDITIEGIRAEGLTSAAVHVGDMEIAIQEWKILWDSTIKKTDLPLYGWYVNPWVWVIEFERCAKPCE